MQGTFKPIPHRKKNHIQLESEYSSFVYMMLEKPVEINKGKF
jgi:hypothetical protein